MDKRLFIKSLLFLFSFLFCTWEFNSVYCQDFNLSSIRPVPKNLMNQYGSGQYFAEFEPFKATSLGNESINTSVLSEKHYVTINSEDLKSIVNSRSQNIKLAIPFGNQKLSLLLTKADVLSSDFKVSVSGKIDLNHVYTPGTYFRGMIEGDYNSLVALSFFDDNIVGMISTSQKGNIIIAKTDQRNTYLLYSDRDLQVKKPADCKTVEPEGYAEEVAKYLAESLETRDAKCFKQYLECDYALFTDKGSVDATVDWVTAVYNNVAALYANENLSTQISEVYVWTTSDPYSQTSSYSALKKFRETRPSFNGDLAQLVALGGNNIGGIAWINSLCTPFHYSYANVYSNYDNVPVYSWTVEVMTHEIGHNLGSPHTHSCTWPGGPIDNCYYVEGNCNPGPPPTNGGTIMSYCHLTDYGINFNNGFGPLPGDLIRSKVNDASCLGYCDDDGDPVCNPPENITISNITNNSALVSWSNALNGTSYVVEYKISTSDTWIALPPVTGTSQLLTNLTAGTTYHVRIKTNCGDIISEYSPVYAFTTGNSCDIPSGLVVTEITQNSAKVSWNPVSGATSYDFRYKLSSSGTWNTFNITGTTVTFSGLTANTSYDVCVRAKCGTVNSDYCPVVTFVTLGDEGGDGYCSSYGINSAQEWIDKVEFAGYSNQSGNNGGYGMYLKELIQVHQNTYYIFTGQAGLAVNNNNLEYWTVWIDYNQNGSMNDAGEKVLQFITKGTYPGSHKFLIPSSAPQGYTWMRVQMKRGSFSGSCEVFPYGEVEEYTIEILPSLTGGGTSNMRSFFIYPNPFTDVFSLDFESEKSAPAQISISDVSGKTLYSNTIEVQKGENTIRLDAASGLCDGVYIVKVIGADFTETHKIIKTSGR
ncbi:MAG: fibronectin type III domain-containing protein [Saprospiraceae bacterium]|nr:fibronectin type III domain-containing protein [Saprospiraceae bacterium]